MAESVEATSPRQDEAKADEKRVDIIMKASEIHLVVATLLVTVTFAAGFTLPGGFESDSKIRNKGTAILLRNTAFRAFVVADAIAFACSTGAVFMYFVMAEQKRIAAENYGQKYPLLIELYVNAGNLLIFSMVAIVIAFVTGMYATLGDSTTLAVAVCVIGCTSFLTFLSVCVSILRYNKYLVINVVIFGRYFGDIRIPPATWCNHRAQ